MRNVRFPIGIQPGSDQTGELLFKTDRGTEAQSKSIADRQLAISMFSLTVNINSGQGYFITISR